MNKLSTAELLELPVSERLQIVEEIWNSIAEAPVPLALSDADKLLIDERLAARSRDSSAGSPWSDVHARVTGRKT